MYLRSEEGTGGGRPDSRGSLWPILARQKVIHVSKLLARLRASTTNKKNSESVRSQAVAITAAFHFNQACSVPNHTLSSSFRLTSEIIIMGNTLDGYCYRLKNNDADLVEICCNEGGLEQIGDDGAMDFSSALAVNTTLHTLDLGGMGISDEGVEALAHALVLNDSLTLLRLHRNKISDIGAVKLIAALRHNHSITALYLAMNSIRDDTLNEEVQKLVAINKQGPKEAARKKSELYSPGWVAEGAELKREAEAELCREAETMSAMTVESQEPSTDYPSLMCGYSRGHEKID